MNKLRAAITFLLIMAFSHILLANEAIDYTDGLEVKITNIHGLSIGHDPDYPADGIGTSNYLSAVCHSLGYDDFVWDLNRTGVQKAKYAYYDMSAYQWKKETGPGLIYKYVVCKTYVAK